MPPQPNGSLLRFGVFDLDPQTCVLRKNGRPLKLQPQPARVLALLVARPNELITREELREKIWGNGNYGDFEHALNVCISQLREVLDDDAESPRWIETVPRRGYRFLAPVEGTGHISVPASIKVEQPGSPTHESPAARPNRKLLAWRVVALVTLALCFGAGYLLGRRKAPAVSSPSFTRLTYERGIIFSARFAPDGQVVYDASWDNKPVRIFTTHAGILQPMQLDLASAHLLDISPTGELALALNGYPESHPFFLSGTLARAPMAGGAPRQLLEDVRWADFDSKAQLAVVHHSNNRSRLEYPIGRVLYENTGWISHIRFSPKNDLIAFVDHPIWDDDGGSIVVVDSKSQERKILSTGWGSAQGLAWSASGDEVWFTAARSGERRDLFAVGPFRPQRTLLRVPGGITLQDISRDGRVLLTVDNERTGTTLVSPTGERDLSWLDLTFPRAVSSDGKQVLLEEQSERSGPDYWVGLRSTEGSAPVRLGEGVGGNFSPDGKWTATNINSFPESTFLLPIGPGERRELRHPGIKAAYPVWFMPDGQSVVFSGIEAGHSTRSYVQDLQGGPPRPITPEGVTGRFPSPDGQYLVALQPDQTHAIYDIQRGESHAIPGITWQLWPTGWSPDSRYLYMYTKTSPPSQIWRLDISSGKQRPVTELSPTDPAGILEIVSVQMTRDAKTFLYAYDRYLSELYVVDGLR
ncbi:MAG TPA: winged helix-turn-helix domain-containing protein [Candidatus Acidoferrum sp.]|nr:winged helix-turn-helix domain-containing protein [Candidatus Acidoferrum sp.]